MRFEFVLPLPKSNSQPTREITSGVKEGPMSEAKKALIRRVIEELFNKHNAALIDELYPDCVYRAPAVGELRGEAYKQFLTSVLAGFPDGRWTVEDQVAEGDKVVTRWSFTGIHRGNVMGIAPTGKQVTTSGVMIDGFRIDTVKHVEMGFWQTWCPAIHAFAAAHGKPDSL